MFIAIIGHEAFFSEVLEKIQENRSKSFYGEYWRSAFGMGRSAIGLNASKTPAPKTTILFDIFRKRQSEESSINQSYLHKSSKCFEKRLIFPMC